MATMAEVRRTVDFIKSYPSSGKLTIMQCTSIYPCPNDQINLNVIDTYLKESNEEIGFSDHSEGLLASPCAVAKGASMIEKHFTLSCGLIGPDHKASLDPDMLRSFVRNVRSAEELMGLSDKFVTPLEAPNRTKMRKSLNKDDSGRSVFQRPALHGDNPWNWEA